MKLSGSEPVKKQEAQLLLRNRASAIHFSVAKSLFVTHTANKLQHAIAARAHDMQPHCRLKSPF